MNHTATASFFSRHGARLVTTLGLGAGLSVAGLAGGWMLALGVVVSLSFFMLLLQSYRDVPAITVRRPAAVPANVVRAVVPDTAPAVASARAVASVA